jgi:hypothetical protein
MEMIVHQYKAVKDDGIDIDGLVQKQEKTGPVCIILKDISTFVAAAGHMIDGTGILEPERAGHADDYGTTTPQCQVSRSDPIIPHYSSMDGQAVA